MVSDSSASGGETAAISDPDKNFTYLLVTEKLPQLIAYMPKIKSSKQGIHILTKYNEGDWECDLERSLGMRRE